MSEIAQLMKQINELTRVVSSLGSPIPFNKVLWGREKLAEYFNCSVDTVDRLRKHEHFPKGRRRSFDSDRGGAMLWKAEEVVRFSDLFIFE
ncbi:MAG: hypothetical protein COB22_05990 [Cycloclasticus sp.]|nr:MAG: hypothetical protein COB22_05990 [Cycloclasticus sp.]